MVIYDITQPNLVLPRQLVVDTSFLLALRPADDNPHAGAAQAFMRRAADRIAALEMIVWLPLPVLQECYHIVLMSGLRRIWSAIPQNSRPANWLKLYKDQPEQIQAVAPELTTFRDLLAAIPVTPVRSIDLNAEKSSTHLGQRLLDFITTYHLLPQDALILAQAERLGVKAVATLDRDWQRATAFTLYTIP